MPQYVVLDCKKCSHYTICKIPCVYVDTLANGNIEQRERPIDTDIIERTDQRNYNQVLGELIEDARQRDIERLEQIRAIQSHRTRMIAASILVGIPQAIISNLINITQGRISQLYRTIKS